jgi:hypothetical protein
MSDRYRYEVLREGSINRYEVLKEGDYKPLPAETEIERRGGFRKIKFVGFVSGVIFGITLLVVAIQYCGVV